MLIAGCGDGDGDDDGDADPQPEGTKVWFTAGEQFEPVDADSPDAGPKTAVRELLDGPASKQRAPGDVPVETQIPEGASLEQLDVDDDGTAVVKLSPEFAGGVPAEPSERSREQQADLDARVAQVTYTLTQFEGVEGARLVSGDTVVEPQVDRRELAAPKQGPKPVVRARGPKLPGTRAIQNRLAKLSYLPKRAIDGSPAIRQSRP